MISKKTKYALKALLVLTQEYPGSKPVLINDLADRAHAPKKFLELILLELKNKGILQSRKGKGGGYLLARSPELITVGSVVRILDGPLAPVRCVSQTAYQKCDECEDEDACAVRAVMKEVRDAIAGILDGTSLLKMSEKTKMSLTFHI